MESLQAEHRSRPLSRQEFAVALLVAEGMTNREIGQQLFVSHRTIDSHVAHALKKLGLRRRAQLAGVVAHQTP
jgi:DNA-binding NarL/FixJ family response regulator